MPKAPDASGSGIPNAAAVVRNRCSTGRVSVPSSSLTNIEEPRYHSTTLAPETKGAPVTNFNQMATTASGHQPYPWQSRVAAEGLPELLAVETGAGKTAGVVLPWLWRRRLHPDIAVRAATPHWLVFCLPLRVLVEQVEADVRVWLDSLGLTDMVPLHVAMGGREDARDPWRLHPERDAIVLGTVDMLISRALNRGYGASRFSWPIDYGLFNNGTHWIFDEVQLLGPALATGRQLQGLRRILQTALPTSSTWMSATVDPPALRTVDNPTLDSIVTLTDQDRANERLATRLGATKTVRQIEVDRGDKGRSAVLARELVARHRPGTLSLAVLNTVRTAREVHAEVIRQICDVPVTLLHSRFRPGDRRERVQEVLADLDPAGPGRVVVSTQVVEAGVDLSAATLLTEAAPWPSIVQRAGRCNRDGLTDDAVMLWAESLKITAPYEEADVAATTVALRGLEGMACTATSMRELDVSVVRQVHAVLRRDDLLGLFDTAPDLSGNDIDIAPFIRVTDELDLQMAWRPLEGARPTQEQPTPTADELCPVPAGKEIRELSQEGGLWRLDHLGRGQHTWVRLTPSDVRPGIVVLADSSDGGYSPAQGWDPTLHDPVPAAGHPTPSGLVDVEEAVGDDPVTYASGTWVTLHDHLRDVEAEVRTIFGSLAPPGLEAGMTEAAAVAGRLHDVGKAHQVFQNTMQRSAPEADRASRSTGGPWAKSGGPHRPRHSPPFFRHELASALALLSDGKGALWGVAEPELVVYLVAAHHGRIRLGIRSVPQEEDGRVLGVADGDPMPAVQIPGGELPPCRLSLGTVQLGRGADGAMSWAGRALALLERDDIGPFRLSYLEAIVRLADWRASAAAEARS